MLSAFVLDPRGQGYVNFADSQWKPLREASQDECGDDCESENDGDLHDPVNRCTEYVGSMKIAAMTIDVPFYDTSSGFSQGCWNVFFKRLPDFGLLAEVPARHAFNRF